MSNILHGPLEIQERIQTISQKLNELYNVENEQDVVLMPILQGVVPFFSDLSKKLLFNPYVDYVGISSYEGEEQKEFHLYKLFNVNLIANKKIWLFDDLADSGNTLQFLKNLLIQYGAAEVHTCVLLKKKHCTFEVDLCGFEIGNEWVYGYGMDDSSNRGRLLDTIYYT